MYYTYIHTCIYIHTYVNLQKPDRMISHFITQDITRLWVSKNMIIYLKINNKLVKSIINDYLYLCTSDITNTQVCNINYILQLQPLLCAVKSLV